MKNLITTLAAVASFATIAQPFPGALPIGPTSPEYVAPPEPEGKAFGGYELTIGGGGTAIDGEHLYGLDVTLSTNPLKPLPDLWFGIAQGAYWEPEFGGSTDLYADWNWHLFSELYLNTGWSVGVVYGDGHYFRTGPQLTFQFYVTDSSFIYAGANYDLNDGQSNGFRYSFGVGIAFP